MAKNARAYFDHGCVKAFLWGDTFNLSENIMRHFMRALNYAPGHPEFSEKIRAFLLAQRKHMSTDQFKNNLALILNDDMNAWDGKSINSTNYKIIADFLKKIGTKIILEAIKTLTYAKQVPLLRYCLSPGNPLGDHVNVKTSGVLNFFSPEECKREEIADYLTKVLDVMGRNAKVSEIRKVM